MSRRRSLPNETKAKARFDLLARVISTALDGSVCTMLVTNPAFAVDSTDLTLTKETNPARQ